MSVYMVQSTVKIGDEEKILGVCYDYDNDMFYNSTDSSGDVFTSIRVKFAVDWLLEEQYHYPDVIQKISVVPVH